MKGKFLFVKTQSGPALWGINIDRHAKERSGWSSRKLMSLGNEDDNGGEKNEYCSCTASLNMFIHIHVIILLQYTVEYNVIQTHVLIVYCNYVNSFQFSLVAPNGVSRSVTIYRNHPIRMCGCILILFTSLLVGPWYSSG